MLAMMEHIDEHTIRHVFIVYFLFICFATFAVLPTVEPKTIWKSVIFDYILLYRLFSTSYFLQLDMALFQGRKLSVWGILIGAILPALIWAEGDSDS